MSDLIYLHLPKVTDDALVQQAKGFREARLLSLQSDPTSFISRYDDEKDQPLQFTIDRVNDPVAEHFVAMAKIEAVDESQPSYIPRYEGFLVIIRGDTNESGNKMVKTFEMAAVYVRKEHRGKGVCSQMIRHAINWISEDIQQATVHRAIIRTTAAEVNYPAQRLYAKLGFEVEAHTTHRNQVGEDVPIVSMTLHVN